MYAYKGALMMHLVIFSKCVETGKVLCRGEEHHRLPGKQSTSRLKLQPTGSLQSRRHGASGQAVHTAWLGRRRSPSCKHAPRPAGKYSSLN